MIATWAELVVTNRRVLWGGEGGWGLLDDAINGVDHCIIRAYGVLKNFNIRIIMIQLIQS